MENSAKGLENRTEFFQILRLIVINILVVTCINGNYL